MAKDARSKSQFALNVLSGLKRKSEETGRSVSQILKDGGFKQSVYSGVRDATRTAAQSRENGGEIYAYLYVVEGIEEADPRTIPPRKVGKRLTERAWSEERLRRYRESLGRTTERTQTPPPPVLRQEGAMDAAFRRILREELSGLSPSRNDIGHHLAEARRLIESEGTTLAKRNDIAINFQDELTALLPIVDAYTHSPEKREEALRLREVTRGR